MHYTFEVEAFWWEAIPRKVLTQDNLTKREIEILSLLKLYLYPICNEEED